PLSAVRAPPQAAPPVTRMPPRASRMLRSRAIRERFRHVNVEDCAESPLEQNQAHPIDGNLPTMRETDLGQRLDLDVVQVPLGEIFQIQEVQCCRVLRLRVA